MKEHLLHASNKPTIERYYNRIFDWQEGIFELVYWTSVKQVRSRMQLAQFHQTSKIMCGWLATNNMQSHVTGVSGCSRCRCQKETLDHVLQCPNKEARELRKSALAAFEAEGKKRKIPRPVMEKIYHLLTNYMQGREGVVAAPGSNALDVVTNQQMTIGLKLLRLGFLAKGWKDAIEEGGTEQSEHKLTHLQWILWSTVMVPLWNKRCEI